MAPASAAKAVTPTLGNVLHRCSGKLKYFRVFRTSKYGAQVTVVVVEMWYMYPRLKLLRQICTKWRHHFCSVVQTYMKALKHLHLPSHKVRRELWDS